MPSRAEIDLIVDATRTLALLEADLARVIAAAQAGADDIDITAAINQARTVTTLRHDLDTAIRAAQAGAPDITVDVDVDTDRLSRSVRSAVSSLTSGSLSLARFGATAVSTGAAIGALPPLLAGVTAAVEQIAPAAAVATTGILALQLVTNTVKLGMIGVSEAVQGAFDPDVKPEDLAKQMARLAPEARKAVTEIVKLKPAFKGIQQDVQNRLFKDFDAIIKDLSTSVLPQLGTQLGVTATTLNSMGKEVGSAASQLGDAGVLGQALKSANTGLKNLTSVPAQVVTAFTELAAAAGPSFERITKAAAGVADRVSEQLTGAFTSGGLQDAIEGAVDSLTQLGRVGGNIFGTLGNLMAGVTQDGRGLFDTLEEITGALKDATGSKAFQAALSELSAVSAKLVATVLPLLGDALGFVGQVVVALGPSVRQLIGVLGDNLGKVVKALGPVLVAFAEALALLVPVLTPFIDLAGDLISAILPALTPLFEALGQVFQAMAPFVKAVADTLGKFLVPIFESLTPLLETILPPLVKMAEELFPQLQDIVEQMAPSFKELGNSLGELIVAFGPLIELIIRLNTEALSKLLEAVGPTLVDAIKLFTLAIQGVSDLLSGVALQSFQIIIDLLNGDYQQAIKDAGTVVSNMETIIGKVLSKLLGVSRTLLGELALAFLTKAREAASNLAISIAEGITDAQNYIAELPGRARDALGNLGDDLYGAGQDLIQGLINGMASKLTELANIAANAAATVKNGIKGALGINSPSRVTMELGVDTMDGFINGIASQIPDLETQINQVFASLPDLSAQVTALDAPKVSVTPTVLVGVQIGNQVLDQYVTTRVEAANARDTRIRAQGVRR